ncbi:hypothetical protein [Roseomonas chloroacetimidivorans]|uniref:hypothetical protein n=1 Tax=Roseomonas chloroacetimidivorans TaxID=1766656 RepID=UPI003C789471
MPAVLEAVEEVIQAELHLQRAEGRPLKLAFDAVARALGVTPRRVRAYHHHEVSEDDVRAKEWIAAQALRERRRAAEVARARAILASSGEAA